MLKKNLNRVLISALLMLTSGLTFTVNAQSSETRANTTDVRYIYFRVGQSTIDPHFRGNASALEDIVNTLLKLQDDSKIDSISVDVKGLTSIEGTSSINNRLAEQRAQVLRDYIADKSGLSKQNFTTQIDKANWTYFRNLVEADSFEGRDEVLRIIDTHESDDVRQQKIVALRGGRVLAHLQKSILPQLRASSVVYIYIYKVEPQPEPVVEEIPVQEPEPMPVVQEPMPVVEEPTPVVAQPQKVYEEIHPWIAVKTNLLLDAALAPNIEVERWFGKHNHWSVMGEVWFPWYVFHNNSRSYEVLAIGAELRYWFFPHNGNLRPLHGQFIGAYAAGGKYDLEWKSKGNHGEFTSLGLTYGYAFRLSKHFNMELSISGGYIGGPYRFYRGMFNDTHLIWQRSEHFRYWGITKAKISLVWLIGDKKD